MKLFKKSVSVFLALLMVFGSVSLLATAADTALYNWSLDTKFYRMQRNADGLIVDADGNVIADENDVLTEGSTPVWIETTKAKKGESVKARIFMTTDFQLGPSDLFFFYPTAFLTHDSSGYAAGTFAGGYAIPTNSDTTNPVGANGFSGNLTYGTDVSGQFDNMVYEGYLTEEDIEGKGWLYVNMTGATSSLQLDGKDWLFELDFIVNKDATSEGQFYLSTECISDYDAWMAATVIAANPDDDGVWTNYELSCDVETGTFAHTLNDRDADSSLSCGSNVTFTTEEGAITGATEYSGDIGATLSTISGFSLPTAAADGKQFLGWSTDGATVLTADDIGALKIGYETLTLKAVYQAAEASYVQNVYTMGTDGAYPEAPATSNIGASTGAKVNASTYSVPAGFTLDADKSTAGDVEVTADGTAALNIYLKRNQYNVAFGADASDMYYEATYTAPEGPAKEGYTFAGWKSGDTVLQTGETGTVGLADIAYEATYAPAANKVTIVINYVDQVTGEAATATKEVATTTGNTVALVSEKPAEPAEKTDYVLISDLNKIEHYEYTATGSETSVAVAEDGSAVLNVNYIPVKYTATFTGAENGTFTEDYYTSITAPAGPAKDGETFLGWSTDGTTVAVKAGAAINLTGNVTYTALYEPTDYTVTYVFSNTAPEGVSVPAQVTDANMGDAVVLPEMKADGWTFSGWTVTGAVAGDAEGEYKVGTGPVTVTGTWTKNVYTVNFWLDEAKSGEPYSTENYYFGDEVTTPDAPTDDLLVPGTYFDSWDNDTIDVIDADTVDTYFVETATGKYVYDLVAITSDYEYTVSIYYMNVDGYENNVEVAKIEGLYYGDEVAEEDLPDPTTVEGYTFTEWKIGSTAISSWPIKVTKNTDIRGYFTINQYDAVFYANGGAWLDGDIEKTVKVDYLADITAPTENPVREGYHLNAEMPWGVDLGTMFTETQEFYAEWVPNEYTITFDVEGTKTESTQTYGNKITVPADVSTVKAGYTFKGWSSDGGTTVIADITAVDVPAGDTTYTAVFEPAEGGVGYTVNRYFMDLNGSYDGVTPEVITTLKAVADTEVTYNVEVEGFTLDKSLGNLTEIIKGDGTTVINAYYARKQPAVTYVAQGATVDTVNVYYGAALAASTVYTTAPEGYNLLGWSRSATATAADDDLGTMNSVDGVTLYAVLDPIEYKANFVFAYEGTEQSYGSTDVSYNTAIAAPTAPTADQVPAGYTFKGWAATKGATEALTDLGTMDTTAGKTFYAVLESKTDIKYNIEKYFMETDGVTYTLDAAKSETKTDGVAGETKTITADTYEGFTFDDDNAENVLTAMIKGNGTTTFKVYYNRNTVKVTIGDEEPVDKYYGEEIEQPADVPEEKIPEGNKQDGWEDENGDPVEFPVKVGTEDIVIKPNFVPDTFLITFMNGTETVQSTEQTYGEVITVPAEPVLAGHSFDGWYSGDTKIDAGTTTVPAADTVYTAQFTPINYTVKFVANGAEVSTGEYAFGSAVVVPEYSAPAGYEMKGWSTDGSTVLDMSKETVPVNGVIYYAVLEAAEGTAYTVEIYTMNTNGTTYAKSSETKYAVTDTVINYEPVTKTGFTLNSEKSTLTGTVTGDGKMVIRVYYDRNTVKVTIDGTEGTYYFDEEIEHEDPTPDPGYTFDKWVDDDGNTVTFPMNVPAEDIVITPVYAPIKYAVTFNVNGTEYATGMYDYNSDIVAPETPPVVTGYTFQGWSTDGVNVLTDLGKVAINGNTFQAVLTPNEGIQYTVKKVFQSTDGASWNEPIDDVRTGTAGATVALVAADEAVSGFAVYQIDPATTTIKGDGTTVIYIYYTRNKVSVTINGDKDDYYYEEEITEPEEPTKDGYDFKGWEDEEGNPVTFPIKVPAEDMVITPVYEAQTKSLSFEVDGVTVTGYPTTAKVDSEITAPAAPTKDGYSFVGWYIKGTNTAFNGKMPTSDTVYEAKWTAGSNTKYTIEIYIMDTDGQYSLQTSTLSYGVTGTIAEILPNDDAIKGFTHDAALSELSKEIAADGSTVLKIYYARDLYTVTWNVDGIETEDKVYFGAAIVAPADPAKTGYTFTGWTPDVPATMPEGDLEFTATWAEASYTVTYVVNGTKTVETYKYNDTVTVMAAPSVEGMTFDGWFDGATEYVAGSTFSMPAENLIIVADFSVGVYKVTYLDATGAVFATEMVKFGDAIPVPDGEPTKEYYVFTGWEINYDTMPAEDIVVAPIFERIPVKLIPMAGSTTVIDRDNNIIYGLQEFLNESILRGDYLDVEGDGYFTITPVSAGYYGTGAKVELYDNLDPSAPIETYTIVVFGDINGDSLVQAIDSTYADDENLMLTDWSSETVYNGTEFVANPNYDPYKTMAADLNGDGIIDSTDATIIGDASIGIEIIDQVTGRTA